MCVINNFRSQKKCSVANNKLLDHIVNCGSIVICQALIFVGKLNNKFECQGIYISI